MTGSRQPSSALGRSDQGHIRVDVGKLFLKTGKPAIPVPFNWDIEMSRQR